MPRMREPEPVTATPLDGGHLIADGSIEKVGFNNYSVRRDWRREEADEVRQEGHDYFRPLLDVALGNQPYPQNQPNPPSTPEPITMMHMARRPDGRIAFLAGTPTTLYRFEVDDGEFFSEVDAGSYFEEPTFGPNLVVAASGNYTVNGLTIGKLYFWKKGVGETSLTHNSVTYQADLQDWWPDGFYFRAQTASVSVVGSGSPAGTISEVLVEPYYEHYGSGATAVVGTDVTFMSGVPRKLALGGVRFFDRVAQERLPIGIRYDGDAAIIGDDATVTWDGSTLNIKVNNAGLTTRQTVETKVRLSDFVLDDTFQVAASDYFAKTGGPFFESPGLNQPFFQTGNGSWKVIGSGFSKLGSRWQVKDSNGYTVFNNGVDLPVTYRVGDESVTPIYELREQGIAAVGIIEVYSTILKCFDILQIASDRMASLFAHTPSGAITASQTGSQYSNTITATQVGATNDVQSSAPFFDAGWVSRTIQFENGFTTTITAFVNNQRVTLAATPTSVGATPMVFWVIHLTNDYLVNASANFFDATMVGKYLYWDTKSAARKILAVNSATQARVDEHLPISSGTFKLENTTAYSLFDESKSVERIQYRTLWGVPDEPTRFAAIIPCATVSGSALVELTWPVKSLASGDSVLILGAGELGSNLTATILNIAPNRTTVLLDRVCKALKSDSSLQRSASVGSIVGFLDLQDDSRPIVAAGVLDKRIVVYNDGGAIFVGRYTGNVLSPFDYGEGPVYRGPETPYYRHTLIDRGDFHVYAGRNNFYNFSLVTRRPQIVPLMERMKSVFYKQATIANTNLIFAADNILTKQIFLCFPSSAEDKGIAYDYEHDRVSTLGTQYTALAAIIKPKAGLAIGEQENWVVCGDSTGRVLQYGRADVAQEQWDGGKAIYHRLGVAVRSVLKSGMFGHPVHESELRGYLVQMATQNPGGSQMTVNVYGFTNPSETPRLLFSEKLEAPNDGNFIPTHFLECYFQDELICEVLNDARMSRRSVLITGVASKSALRRE